MSLKLAACLLFLNLVESQVFSKDDAPSLPLQAPPNRSPRGLLTLPPRGFIPPLRSYESDRYPVPIPDGRRYWIDPENRRYLIEQFNGMIAERNLFDVIYQTLSPLPPHLMSGSKELEPFETSPIRQPPPPPPPPPLPPPPPPPPSPPRNEALPSICRLFDGPELRHCSDKLSDNFTILVEPLRTVFRGRRVPREAYPYAHRIMFNCVKVIDDRSCHTHKIKKTKSLTVNVFVMEAGKLAHSHHQDVTVPPEGTFDITVIHASRETGIATDADILDTINDDLSSQQLSHQPSQQESGKSLAGDKDSDSKRDAKSGNVNDTDGSNGAPLAPNLKPIVTRHDVVHLLQGVRVVKCDGVSCAMVQDGEDEDPNGKKVTPIQHESLKKTLLPQQMLPVRRTNGSLLLKDGSNSVEDHHNFKREVKFDDSPELRYGKPKKKKSQHPKRKSKGKNNARGKPGKKSKNNANKHNKKQKPKSKGKRKSSKSNRRKQQSRKPRKKSNRSDLPKRHSPPRIKVKIRSRDVQSQLALNEADADQSKHNDGQNQEALSNNNEENVEDGKSLSDRKDGGKRNDDQEPDSAFSVPHKQKNDDEELDPEFVNTNAFLDGLLKNKQIYIGEVQMHPLKNEDHHIVLHGQLKNEDQDRDRNIFNRHAHGQVEEKPQDGDPKERMSNSYGESMEKPQDGDPKERMPNSYGELPEKSQDGDPKERMSNSYGELRNKDQPPDKDYNPLGQMKNNADGKTK